MRSWDCLCRLVSPRIARYAGISANLPNRLVAVTTASSSWFAAHDRTLSTSRCGTVVGIANVVDTKIFKSR